MKLKNSKVAGMIMSLAVIGVLFIPTLAISEVEQRTTNRTLQFEGNYINGTIIHIKSINKPKVELLYSNEIIIGSDLNNDSYIYADDNIVKQLYYGNWVTYIGNGTYQINYDKADPPFTISALEWNLGIPLAINGSTLASYDFIRITMTGGDFPHPMFFEVWVWPPYLPSAEILSYAMDTNKQPITHEKMLPLIYNHKSTLNTMNSILGYEYDIYAKFQAVPYIPESNQFGDGNFTFKIEAFNFTDEHSFYWSDEQIVYMSIGGATALMILGAAFTTNTLDIKVNRIKQRRTRK